MRFVYSTITAKDKCLQFDADYCQTLTLNINKNILSSMYEPNTGYLPSLIDRIIGGYVDCGEWGGGAIYRNPVATLYKLEDRWYCALNGVGNLNLEKDREKSLNVLRSPPQMNPLVPVHAIEGKWEFRKVNNYGTHSQYAEWIELEEDPFVYDEKCGALGLTFQDPPVFIPEKLNYSKNLQQKTCSARGYEHETIGGMIHGEAVRRFVKGTPTPEKPIPVLVDVLPNDIEDDNQAIDDIESTEYIEETGDDTEESFHYKENPPKNDVSYPETYKMVIAFLCFVFLMFILIVLCLG